MLSATDRQTLPASLRDTETVAMILKVKVTRDSFSDLASVEVFYIVQTGDKGIISFTLMFLFLLPFCIFLFFLRTLIFPHAL